MLVNLHSYTYKNTIISKIYEVSMNKSSKRQMLLSADLTTFSLLYIPLGEEWKQLRGQQYLVRIWAKSMVN